MADGEESSETVKLSQRRSGNITPESVCPTPVSLSSLGPCYLRCFIKESTRILGLKIPNNRQSVYPITRGPPTYPKDFPLQKIQDPLNTESDARCPAYRQSFVFTPCNPCPRGTGHRVIWEWGRLSIHSRKIPTMS